MPDPGREFLLRVHSSPEGWKATVREVTLHGAAFRYHGITFVGQGATEVAACLAALSQAKLGEPVDGHDSPRSPDAV